MISIRRMSSPRSLKVIDFEVVEWPSEALGIARRVWDFVRIARLPGGGESRDVWKLGPAAARYIAVSSRTTA